MGRYRPDGAGMIPGIVAGQMRQAAVSIPFADAIAADSPYLWWRMGEASGTAIGDSSGNSRVGTISGTVGTSYDLGQASLVGDGSTSIKFKDNSGYIRSNTRYTIPLTNMTYAIAFKSDVSAGVGVITHLSQNSSPDTGSGARDRGFVLGSDGKVYFTFWDGSASRRIGSLNVINDGTRHIIHAAVGGSDTELFVDGVSQGSIPYVPGASYAAYIYVARMNVADLSSPLTTTSSAFKGVLDEHLMFSSRLSSARILAHAVAAGLA